MMRFSYVLVLTVAIGCGDNTHLCGPGKTYDDATNTCIDASTCGKGTMLDPGTRQCVPDGSVVCAQGTKLDTKTGNCVPDPDACQAGTVLVGGRCVDPTGQLAIDLDEGVTEPNGFGVIEDSGAPAGGITLKPVGGVFVIHGTIAPYRDADGDGQPDPDVDTYTVKVTEPTLVDITADGVGGIDAGFVALGPMPAWVRFGMNVSGDTSHRQVYLPAAGTYSLAIADTRTLFVYATGGPPRAAPGPGDYYISIAKLAMPTPSALAVTGGTATTSATLQGDVGFYTVPMGTGFNEITLQMPSIQATAAVDVLSNGAYRGNAIAPGAGLVAQLVSGGFNSGDQTLVVADSVYDFALAPVAYTLDVRTSDAQALTGTASETIKTTTFTSDVLALDQFYFDVTANDQTLAMAITWNHPVVGSLYDQNRQLVATYTPGNGAATWSAYGGLVRVTTPGRYYFLVYDPSGTAGSTVLTATSQISPIDPTAITEATPTGPIAIDASVNAAVFTYDAGTTDPWQTFDATGTNTGGEQIAWFDPTKVYGRLDTLATSGGSSAANGAGAPLVPMFQHTYAAGGGAIGRVLLDDTTTRYYVKVNPVAPTTGASVALAFDKRTITDLGALAANTATTTSNDHQLGGGTAAGYFLFRTSDGNRATITTHPHTAAALDTRFQRVRADESALGALVNNGNLATGGDDSETFVQGGAGWTAVIVTPTVAPLTAQLYDVSVRVDPGVSYAETTDSTAFATICGGGAKTLTFSNGVEVGTTAAPAGFAFYGVPATAFQVSANGFLSFATLASASPVNQDLPDPGEPNALVAAYWDSLAGVTACTRAVSTTVTGIEWNGVDSAGLAVHVQVFLDAADDSIAIRWSSAQTASGASATIGVEDPAGAHATRHSFDTAGAITAGSGVRYTPM